MAKRKVKKKKMRREIKVKGNRINRFRFDELKKDGGYAAIMLIEGCRPDTIMHTDIGTGGAIDRRLREAGVTDIFAAEKIIRCYHDRGRDESVNRSVKDFYGGKLPFKRFYADPK